MYIYVIEMVVNCDVITSHVFLTYTNAYHKFIELVGLYYDSDEVSSIFFIERDVNDQSGEFNDRLLDKMESLKSPNTLVH